MARLAATLCALALAITPAAAQVAPASTGTPAAAQNTINSIPWVNGKGLWGGQAVKDNLQSLVNVLNGMGTWDASGKYAGPPPTAAQVASGLGYTPLSMTDLLARITDCAPIDLYGGSPTLADNTAAWNTAMSTFTANNGGCVAFKRGTYKFLSALTMPLAANEHVSVLGTGPHTTVLTWPNPTNGIVANGAAVTSSFSLRDLAITTGQRGGQSTPYTGVTFNGLGLASTNEFSDISNVAVHGQDGFGVSNYWDSGATITGGTGVNIDRLQVVGTSDATISGTPLTLSGLIIQGSSVSNQATQINVTNSTFSNVATGVTLAFNWQGVNLSNVNIDGCANGITQTPNAPAGVLSGLQIVNSQVACNLTDITFGSPINGYNITGNFLGSTGSTNGINSGATGNGVITGNFILGGGGGFGVAMGGSAAGSRANVVGNTITGFANSFIASSTAAYVSFLSNFVTAPPVISSANHIDVRNNPGYNPVGAQSFTPGASPWTYVVPASPETEYYAASGGISALTQNGVSILPAAVAANTTIAIPANPNDTLVITYTGTLTGRKMVN